MGRSSGVSATCRMRSADAVLRVYIMKMRVMDRVAVEIIVKYCVNATMVPGSVCLPITR